MIGRGAIAALLLLAPALSAQTVWDPNSWTPEGWEENPLIGQPLREEGADPLQMETAGPRARPLDRLERDDPLVMSQSHNEKTTALLAEVAPSGATLRALDRVSGEIRDLALQPGQTARIGKLEVTLQECRYPADNPASDAYAYVDIVEMRAADWLFSGWMLASSPALNSLDHRRYDVWVLRCNMT
ncbi:hypothetical protein RGUI_3647 [Rhodovulum sp. P5]|uniref:DUF2155 domain-containing protein n=1 Tax=Rhodovulum sp. P5 TaxID=1564506 RepID=UPI0009C1D08F|nr:DUF2155 domain-containing protein [Rhodovulum sp. P5]ARE41788.1 hypothetical protein RGUI_3647 [Rhodovulum sp. P5]